jgi:hypothetical protein
VIWNRLPNSPWMRATEIASPLPFSNRMIAIRRLMFSRVDLAHHAPARLVQVDDTAGRWSWSKVAWAPVNWSPVITTIFFVGTCVTVPSRWRSVKHFAR